MESHSTKVKEEMESKMNDDQAASVTENLNFPDDSDSSVNTAETDIDSLKNSAGVGGGITFKIPTITKGSKRPCPINKSSTILETQLSENSDGLTTKSLEQVKDPPFPYVEPQWGGKPTENYQMEVLKSGVIQETISLDEQSYHVIGRLPTCHISLAHPTISRYHAILQYRFKEDSENPRGFYVFDLGSTHGTFWNGNRIKPHMYVRIQGGHMLRFGCSQRKYILQAPPEDQEEESEYTLTQLKEMRAEQLTKRSMEDEKESTGEENDNDGIDWGMGEEADEETDLQENPYATITDDDLVLDDPKKTLRGWFEREGYNLQYQTEEKGLGQFLCWVDLPMEDIVGHSVRAEALVKGKKKEAVIQCALEACKILDKYGLLRQANHEARKRKTRNWEAEDYYDSDEDNFLDRTGSVERKREHRMRLAGKLEEKVETYDSLLEKHKEVTKRISHLSSSIKIWRNAGSANKDGMEEDALDAFMSTLSSSTLTKSDIAKMKLELQHLRKEEANLIKLLNLTRPANLPPLTYQEVTTSDESVHSIKQKTSSALATSSDTSKIQDSVLRRTRKKQATHRTNVKSNLSSAATKVQQTEVDPEKEEEEEDEEEERNDKESVIDKRQDDRSEEGNESSVTEKKCLKIKENSETTTQSTRKRDNQQKLDSKDTKSSQRQRKMISCDQDVYSDNYSTWVPPKDQTGDGKTSLNDKYGY